jgi:co-chaperonin GroES (HSP10)
MKHFNVGDLVVLTHYSGQVTEQGIVLCHNWQERKVEVYLIGEGKTRTLHDSRVRVLSKNTDGGAID